MITATCNEMPVATSPDATKSLGHVNAILSHPFHRCKKRPARWKGWGTRPTQPTRGIDQGIFRFK